MPSDRPRVLLVDDDTAVHRAVALRLRGAATVTATETTEGALALVQNGRFDLALVDVNLRAGLPGTMLVPRLLEVDADLAAVIFTAYGDYRTALDSFAARAFDFIPKSLQDDREFLFKVERGIAHTRSQRAKSGGERTARTLAAALGDTVVAGELDAALQDLQRSFIEESLQSFSAVLGRAELLDQLLHRHRAQSAQLGRAARYSEAVVSELQDRVEKLRDQFAKPRRAASSVNALLAQAVRIAQEAPEPSDFGPIECAKLKPDWPLQADGPALLRVIVILHRLLRRSAPAGSLITFRTSIMHQPAVELLLMLARCWTRVLRPAQFSKAEPFALDISVSASLGRTTLAQAAALFEPSDRQPGPSSPWSALALVAKLGGALIAETLPQGNLSYRIIGRF